MQHTSCGLLHQLLRATPPVTAPQVRTVFLTFKKMDEAMEHLQCNPFYNKYAQKIDKVKQSQPVALVAAISQRKAEVKSDASDPLAAAAGVKKVSDRADQCKAPLPRGAYSFAPQKKLDSVMKIELLVNKTAKDVTYVWTQHWRQHAVISGVLSTQLYQDIRSTADSYDRFLFALPREQGYEFILAQFAALEVHFTPLVNYQAYQENAPECLTMVHYTDLQDDLGIVLMKGDYDSKIISGKEAQFLANQVQLYYSGHDPQKVEMVRNFHHDPTTFQHSQLIRDLETLDLGALGATSSSTHGN